MMDLSPTGATSSYTYARRWATWYHLIATLHMNGAHHLSEAKTTSREQLY
jgi:hypothetical protein